MKGSFHYSDCGLPNIYLTGDGIGHNRSPYGRGVSVRNLDQLHKLITLSIVSKPGIMTGVELRFLRMELHLSVEQLAEFLGCDQSLLVTAESTGKVPMLTDQVMRYYCREELALPARVVRYGNVFNYRDGNWSIVGRL